MGFLQRYAFLAACGIIVSVFSLVVTNDSPIAWAMYGVTVALLLMAIVIFFEEEDRK